MPNRDYWENYWIDTPTFDLVPVEKPDMSPFLFHMTGRNAILSILKGEGSEETVPKNSGWLKSAIPESGTSGGYNAPVVCFTESPIFCLDFFRFRSGRRWDADQRYGIGFSKATLINKGVRPCIYADIELRRQINRVSHNIGNIFQTLSKVDAGVAEEFSTLINSIFPLTTPLGEDNLRYQGFMWEREWRYPSSHGFLFNYEDIKVMCCPPEESEQLGSTVGSYYKNIKFVSTWLEYNEVTDYLARRTQQHELTQKQDFSKEKLISLTNRSIKQLKRTILELERYIKVTSTLGGRVQELEENINNLKEQVLEREKQVQELQNDINN